MMLEILSPEQTLFRGEVERVTLPGAMGQFEVLPHHAALISSLVKGRVSYLPKGKTEESVPVESGFVEVKQDVVSVCIG